MSLDKAIEHHKEKRKKYHGSKAVSKSCRPHGGCPWCERSRLRYKRLGRQLDEEACQENGT